jgi:hypothetical protein
MWIKALHGAQKTGLYRYRYAVALSVQVGVAFDISVGMQSLWELACLR